jgi:3-hydroxybutyrate dehydrogenase
MTTLRTDLSGQTALITGSTSGIGEALAEGLAAQGANIVVNGLGDPGKIRAKTMKIADLHGVQCLYHDADMTRPEEIAEMVEFAASELGRLDILVNNAGIQHVEAVETFPETKWDAIMAINLSSVFHAAKAAIPHMKRLGRGRIVNIASAHGLVASPFKSAYIAAKHGVLGFTKAAALELAQDGITVNAICPGYVKTPLVENQIAGTAKAREISEDDVVRDVMLAAQPTKKFVTYEELVGALSYLVSDAGASTNGAALTVDGGWTAQ